MAIVMSEVTAALELLGAPSLDTLQVIDAAALAEQYYPLFDPSSPTLVLNLQGADLGRIRQVLLQAYPGGHEVQVVRRGQRRRCGSRTWRRTVGATALYVPPLPYPGSYSALQNVSARLRAPGRLPVGPRADVGQAAAVPARGDVRAARRAGPGRPAEGARGRGRPPAPDLAPGADRHGERATTASPTSCGTSSRSSSGGTRTCTAKWR